MDGRRQAGGTVVSGAAQINVPDSHIRRRLITPAAGASHSSPLCKLQEQARSRYPPLSRFHNGLIIGSPKAHGAVLLRHGRYGSENNATLLTEWLRRSTGRFIDSVTRGGAREPDAVKLLSWGSLVSFGSTLSTHRSISVCVFTASPPPSTRIIMN